MGGVAGVMSRGGRWVLNQKLQISCIWSLEKLKERLVRMRKLMYQVKRGCQGRHVRGGVKGWKGVLSQNLQISCTLSVGKLKERLVRMRKLMYQVKQGVC